MADTKVLFDIIARDKASQAFKSAGGGASQLEKALGGVAKVAAGGALLAFAKNAVSAARESNRVAAQTEAVIRSTGGAANVTAKQFADLAGEISRKTGVDDEQIQSAENMLATFTNVRNEVGKGNDVFSQATGLIVDMSTAMGTDTSGAAIQLGKALNDPIKGITALTRVGVTFSDQQKEQIRTLVESGKTLDAQKIILAELTKEFGGSAAAQATAADRLKVSLGNIEESVGNLLIPALDKMASGIDFGIRAVQEMPAPLKAAGGAVAITSAGLLAYSKTAELVKSATSRMNGVFGEGAAGAGKLGTAFKVLGGVGVAAGVVVTLKQIHDEMDKVKVDFTELANASDQQLVRSFQQASKWGANTKDVFKAIADTSVTDAQRLIDALKAQGVATGDYQKILDQLIGRRKVADATSRKNAEATSAETDAQDKDNKVTTDAVTIAKNAADADQRRKDLIDGITQALDDRRNAVLADADAEVALARADNAAQDAVNAVTEAIKEHGEKSDETSRAVLDYRSALSSAANAAVDAANKDRAAHGQAALTVQEKVGIEIAELGKLRDTLAPGSPLRKVVDDYIARLSAIPTDINTNLHITANAIPDLQVSVGGGSYTGGGTSIRRATGGPVTAGRPYLVGDKYGLRNAEWFVPKMDGTILPDLGDIGRYMTAAGGSASPIHVEQKFYGDHDPAKAQREVRLTLRELQAIGAIG